MKNNFLGLFKSLKITWVFIATFIPCCLYAQVTVGFQGGEPGDTWGYTSTGADPTAAANALMAPNIVTGTASIVVGGNTPGGSCIDGGAGSGPNVARTFTFNNLDISGSNFYTRTLTFNWGNRFPVCSGTGWDSGENLVFTAYHDGVAQPPVTLAVGASNAPFNINANQYTWNVPPCVENFYFIISITTNRRDELLFLDDVKLTTPALNAPLVQPSAITGNFTVCPGLTETYSVTAATGIIYTWSGLPAGATFTTPNGTTAAHTITIDWGTAAPGTYTLTVTPSEPCGTSGPPQTATVTVTTGPTVSITPSGPTTFCTGGSVTLTSSAGSGNSWSSGSSANAITVTTSGTYTLTYTSACGTATASQTVTVNTLPVVNVNNATTCAGVGVVLTASGANSYDWTPPVGLSATTGNSITATPASTTIYTVTGTDLNGCEGTATSTVTINPAANAAITPQADLCENAAPVTLTTVDGGGTWTATCGTCINAAGQFDPSLASLGANTITYTIAGSCGDTDNITINVNPVPDVTAAPETICSGQTTGINLSSSVAGTNFNWITNPTNVSGASDNSGTAINQTLDVTTPPAGTVIYTITPTAAGCAGTPLNITVTVEGVSIDNITTVPVTCNGLNNGSITITATGATQYSIDGGANFQASSTFTGLTPGTYNIVVENANGCSESSMTTVTEPAVLTFAANPTDETCVGSCNGTATTLTTGGTTPYTYTWSNGAGNVDNAGSLCVGNYTVDVTDDRGCTASAGFTIGSLAGLAIDSVTTTNVLCFGGNTGTLDIYTSPAAAQFSIDGGTSFQPAGHFAGLTQGIYSIVAEHASGCQATTTVLITQPALLAISVSPDTVICPGTAAVITAYATGGRTPYTFNWTDGLSNNPSHSVSPIVTETYQVFVTDSNGCASPVNDIEVGVTLPMVLTPVGSQFFCPGASIAISAIVTQGMAPYTITWINTLDATVLTGADQLVSPAASASYIVTVVDQCSDTIQSSVSLDMYDLPVLQYSIDTNRGCLPLTVNFTSAATPGDGYSFLWNFGDGSNDTGLVTQHTYLTNGCFNISLQVTSTDGCVADTNVMNQVCAYALPIADFNFTPVPADVFHPEINFVNLTQGSNTYQWNFSGIDSSKETNPVFIFPADSAGNYLVCLEATNQYGCLDTVCHWVDINGISTVYVPNAFTPNGDGLNDYFYPVTGDIMSEAYSFLVFNRWGQVVFEGKEPSAKWDGMQNGLICKTDTYVWKLKYREQGTHIDRELVGQVSLLH